MFKFLALVLKAAHLLAKREEEKQKQRQLKFRRARAELAKSLRAEADAARAKADAMGSQAATALAESTIGSNEINEAERLACTLRSQLDYVVAKPDDRT